MAHSYHHAVSSAKRFGGDPDEYLALHNFLDSSKATWGDQRHRAALHHNFGIFVAEEVVGRQEEVRLLREALAKVPRWIQRLCGVREPVDRPVTLTLRNGRQIPIRLLAEQHVIEDCGFIPSLQEYLAEMPRKPWMYRGAAKLSVILDQNMPLPELHAPSPCPDA